MKNIQATPLFQPRRRAARLRARLSVQSQINAQLATTRQIIEQVKALQAETAQLQAENAQTLNSMRSSNVAKIS